MWREAITHNRPRARWWSETVEADASGSTATTAFHWPPCSRSAVPTVMPGNSPRLDRNPAMPLTDRLSPATTATSLGRSEERRVGKECRSRWAPEHEKKKEEDDKRDRRKKWREAQSGRDEADRETTTNVE